MTRPEGKDKMSIQTTDLTVEDLNEMTQNDEWGGFGYLGTREHSDRQTRATMDFMVIEHANSQGWTAEQLFSWANSRNGRHAADVMSDGTTLEEIHENYLQACKWRLMDLPRD